MKNLLIILSLIFCTICVSCYIAYGDGYNSCHNKSYHESFKDGYDEGVRDTKNEDWVCTQAWSKEKCDQEILWTAAELCEKLAMQRLSTNIAYCLTEVKNCTQYDLDNQ